MLVTKTLLLSFFVVLIIASATENRPQENSVVENPPPNCPSITVSCPVTEGDLTFIALVTGGDPEARLGYKWSVVRGDIRSGQGTPQIVVKLLRDGRSITATVEVSGLAAECGKNVASCTITHF
jgi:hypothetical protein